MIPYFKAPDLSLFGVKLHPFGMLIAAAIYLGYHLAKRRARVDGLDAELTGRALVWMVAAAFVGGHLVEVLLYYPERVLEKPLTLLAIWTGLSSFGGFIGAALVMVIFFRRKGESVLAHCDAIMYGLAPAWILGRLGCSIVHDHPGLRSDFFLAVAFPGGARHDLGFYEMLLTVGLTVVLLLVRNRRPFRGFATGLILVLYAPARFGFDFLRTTDRTYLGLTPAQYMAAAALVLGVVLLARGSARRRQEAAQPAPPSLIPNCDQPGPAAS